MAFVPTSVQVIELTANALYTREYLWTIDKSVSPSTWNLFTGDTGTSKYTISVNKDGYVDAATISGHICVKNTGENTTENLRITVALERRLPGQQTFVTIVDPEDVDLSGAPILYPAPGSPTEPNSFCYSYSISIPSLLINTTATYRVVAHVTITNHPGDNYGSPDGPTARTTTTLPAQPTPIHNSITITDTNGGSFPSVITDDATFTYEKTFTCNDDEGSHTNTATIIYDDNTTGPSASATVTVNCYQLQVSKSASTSYTRTYSWTIDKTISEDDINFGNTANFILEVVETHTAYYRVKLIPTSTEHTFKVNGTINIANPAPIAATITNVTDFIQGFGNVVVTCDDITFPYTLAGGSSIQCTYSAELPDLTERTNTATATIQNYDYSSDGSAVESGTTDFTGTAQIIFSSNPTTVEDRCVSVSDSLVGFIGQADALNPSTHIMDYTGEVGPYPNCGNYTLPNTATFTTVDCNSSTSTGATGSDTATANISVPCNGCTHTIGFWKTHAGFTGNNPDLVTPLLPQWLGTPWGLKSIEVFKADQAVKILSFSGDASNGINKLYAQLLAAKLNIAYGADGSVVSSIIAAADAFLANNNAASWAGLSRSQKNTVLNWATVLDNYNKGYLGVPHCSESVEPIEPEIPEDETETGTSNIVTINITISDSHNFRIVTNCNNDSNGQEE